ncbi:MAG TPA: DUF6338 family protein [Solirubrobacterales bacterium]|nr:DUF6338 family protein [Solirubrobacterales bacterium]
MLNTALSILAAVALLMPGFIITELSAARSVRSSRSDLELALRALVYAVLIHLVFAYWTAELVRTVGPPEDWIDHVVAISVYCAVVLFAAPLAIGVALNRYLARVEADEDPPSLFAASLGAGEARDAFDYAYQRWRNEGAWVIIELVDHGPDSPRLVGGIYGEHSAIGQTPHPHDIYLEVLYTVEEDENRIRNIGQRVEPQRGVYIAANQIARIDLVPEGSGTLES